MPWERDQFCKDLQTFADIITRYDVNGYVSSGLSALYRVSGQIRKEGNLRHEINDVVLTVHKKISGTRPIEVKSLNIYIECLCNVDLSLNTDQKDLISEYGLQLVIIGDADGKEYVNCWHLDKDIPPQEGDTHNTIHPSYHFQAGGDGLEGKDTGQLLLVTAPRLPHPPMDIFLAIHFVICNFFNKRDYPFVKNLFEDVDYQDILDRAKQRMFIPYFKAFNQDCKHLDFNLGKVFPLAVLL